MTKGLNLTFTVPAENQKMEVGGGGEKQAFSRRWSRIG